MPNSYRVLRHTDTRWFVQRAWLGLWFGRFIKTLTEYSGGDEERWYYIRPSRLMGGKRPAYGNGYYTTWYAIVFKSEDQALEAQARKEDEESLTTGDEIQDEREYWDIFGDRP